MAGSAVAMVSTNSVSLHPTFDLAAKDAVETVGERLGKIALTLAASILLLGAPPEISSAQTRVVETEKGALRLSVMARGLAQPWGVDILPDGAIIVTEKPGRLRVVDQEGNLSAPLAGVPPVADEGQGGLLDVTVDPAFAGNRLLWLAYSEPAADGVNSTAVAQARLSSDGATLEDVTVVFRQLPRYPGRLHFGARVVFAGDGTLFVTLGERFRDRWRQQAQDLRSHLGKVVRLQPDGTAPGDNPFIGRDDALPEIWSYGHRNVQGAAIHPETGKLWISEHGPRGGDELNIPQPGGNYGWPLVSHGMEYSGRPVGRGHSRAPGLEDPIATWTPAIAPGGIAFYTSPELPGWQGNLLVSGLRARALLRLELEGESVVHEERLLADEGQRIRDVAVAPDGVVYALTDDEHDGRILRLVPGG
ncbi:MAG: PQQ-dependent sugar dehydrogenase [Cyanobacteria bacterium MAG CAR2_bin_4]|nr:PQQ-dependent sugar dehydrogenase [Cyanobacteria bacterium MAG CAR2_bin_4]